ncbi:MAG: hypothetical protein QGG40_08845 [Myxococcota bacterium]|jgi:DNA-binding transcriptional regulator/RsmH inhibitor MraZ|nr:hypothetical protein [Myxococcota bacterium]
MLKLLPFRATLTLDPKGRLSLPKEVKQALEASDKSKLVAVAPDGDQGGIRLFTLEQYNSWIDAHPATEDPYDPTYDDFMLGVLATNQTLQVDRSGRVVIPLALRELGGLTDKVVAFSPGKPWIDIWAQERLDAAQDAAAKRNREQRRSYARRRQTQRAERSSE